MPVSRRLPDGTWNGLLFLATRLSHALETEMDRALAIVGLMAPGFAVLYEIHREPPASQRDLARRLGVEPSTTSELLRRLERKGLIVRRRRRGGGRGGADGSRRDGQSGEVPRHPRQHHASVQLTEAGLAILERAERIAARVESTWAERVRRAPGGEAGEARFHGLRRWLREATAALAEGPGEPATPRSVRCGDRVS